MTLVEIDSFIVLVSIILIFGIILINRRLNYFKDRNIPYLKSFPIFGALSQSLIGKKGIYECTEEIYNSLKFKNEKFFGIFMFHKPALFIKDPELIKQIMVKDFNNFSNHCGGSGAHDPIGSDNLFMAKDELWKNLRKKLTPFFTSGKMKTMFPVLDKISDDLVMNVERM